MLVKICGIQTKQTAHVAAQAGADFIGFVFAPSKRKISPKRAAGIAHTLPDSIKKVGVFVNETVDQIIEIAELVRLDYVQLHGDESPDMISQIPYKTIKAFPIDQFNEKLIPLYAANYFLLDSPSTTYRGGSGKSFDWSIIQGLSYNNLILAGGLNQENVQQAIQMTRPAIVDVSSGVETNGKKDHQKIKQFILNAKGRI